jgi:hyperosmotically inducible periplasmic protein
MIRAMPRVILLSTLVATIQLAGCAGGAARPSTGEYIDDSVITSKLKAALFRDPEVSGTRLNIETFKGQVQLAGFVSSAAERLKAEQIARSVAGVRAVTNSIVVKAQ